MDEGINHLLGNIWPNMSLEENFPDPGGNMAEPLD